MKYSQQEILKYLKSIKSHFKQKGIEIVALFGSFANNTQNIYSDIDIAIKRDKNFFKNDKVYNYFEVISQIKEQLNKKFGKNIDIFDIDSKSDFRQNITKEMVYV
jgi:predicted nucleotidyltransferase